MTDIKNKCKDCINNDYKKTGVPFCWLPQCEYEQPNKSMSNDEFYVSKRWKTLRDKVLRRDKYLCVECKRYGKNVPAKVVHHIKERADYPELQYEMANLESLCLSCHNKRHPEKGKSRCGY